MGGVIVPKTYVSDIEGPLIFLAGPIISAPNWQDEAVRLILSQDSAITIASPRWEVSDAIKNDVLAGNDTYFTRSRAWERHYLDIASKTGAIMFWLPGEVEHKCDKVYGAMTRLELGQWMEHYRADNSVRLCIGSDGKFSELRIIKHDLSLDAPDKEIKSTLEETCSEAIRLARN